MELREEVELTASGVHWLKLLPTCFSSSVCLQGAQSLSPTSCRPTFQTSRDKIQDKERYAFIFPSWKKRGPSLIVLRLAWPLSEFSITTWRCCDLKFGPCIMSTCLQPMRGVLSAAALQRGRTQRKQHGVGLGGRAAAMLAAGRLAVVAQHGDQRALVPPALACFRHHRIRGLNTRQAAVMWCGYACMCMWRLRYVVDIRSWSPSMASSMSACRPAGARLCCDCVHGLWKWERLPDLHERLCYSSLFSILNARPTTNLVQNCGDGMNKIVQQTKGRRLALFQDEPATSC